MLMGALMWLATVAAFAADASPWLGEWGLDPVRSDDPLPRLEMAARAPMLATTQQTRNLSPDRAAQDDEIEAARRRVLSITTGMLARSSRMTLGAPSSDDAGLTLEYGGEDPIDLTLTRKWAKAQRTEGRMKIRAFAEDQLVVERRIKTMTIVETFLPPEEDGSLFSVVRVVGSGMDTIEFRRAYRRLDTELETSSR